MTGADDSRPDPQPLIKARWPRLMCEADAADYLSIGKTMLREHGPKPKELGRRRLYDRLDLERWADRLGGQPLDKVETEDEARDVEQRFLERRKHGRG